MIDEVKQIGLGHGEIMTIDELDEAIGVVLAQAYKVLIPMTGPTGMPTPYALAIERLHSFLHERRVDEPAPESRACGHGTRTDERATGEALPAFMSVADQRRLFADIAALASLFSEFADSGTSFGDKICRPLREIVDRNARKATSRW